MVQNEMVVDGQNDEDWPSGFRNDCHGGNPQSSLPYKPDSTYNSTHCHSYPTMSLAVDPAGSASSSFVTTDEVHLDHLQTCLKLSLKCEVSPTAFCVGSILVLPPPPGKESSGPGLILSTGYSREPPRPTSHAESSAVFKLLALSKEELGELLDKQEGDRWEGSEAWSVEELLKKADCYTTLEPCSVRTSGQPDCARLLAKYQVNRVFLGVEEPPDFVDCAGSRLLIEAGVKVYRVGGLEKECLKYARRGRAD